jgi:hypothetical protein
MVVFPSCQPCINAYGFPDGFLSLGNPLLKCLYFSGGVKNAAVSGGSQVTFFNTLSDTTKAWRAASGVQARSRD